MTTKVLSGPFKLTTSMTGTVRNIKVLSGIARVASSAVGQINVGAGGSVKVISGPFYALTAANGVLGVNRSLSGTLLL